MCAPAEPLEPTVGDECQGVFHSTAEALLATLLVRVSMSGEHDVRFGLGIGEVVMLGERGSGYRQQDGPGWWAARDAVDHVASGRGVPPSLRTWLAMAPPEHARGQATFPGISVHLVDPDVQAVNAYLVTRDHLVSAMDERDRRILRGLLLGTALTDIAAEEGVSKSAVSQRAQRSGAHAVAFAHAALRGSR